MTPLTPFQKSSGYAFGACGNLVRRAAGDNLSACRAAAGPHVDDIIGTSDDIQIMLDDDDGCAAFDERFKDAQKRLHIQRMQADGRFIKDKDGIALRTPHFARQL